MAELSKLLTFVQSEDKSKILQHYNELLDSAEDEQAMLDSFGSPTKLAVMISRDYRQGRDVFAPCEGSARPEEKSEEAPPPEEPPAVEEPSVQEAPEENAPAEEVPAEEAPAEEQTEPVEEPAPQVETKTNIALLIPYLIVAIAVGAAVILAITAAVLFFLPVGALFAFVGVKGIALVFSGMTVLADILVIGGGAAAVLGLAILFIWFAVWLILRGYRGIVRGLKALGRKLCVKEVSEIG